MLSKFAREDEADGSLNLSRGDGGSLVVSRELGGFASNTFKDIIDKRVHNGHSFARDVNVGVTLSQNF